MPTGPDPGFGVAQFWPWGCFQRMDMVFRFTCSVPERLTILCTAIGRLGSIVLGLAASAMLVATTSIGSARAIEVVSWNPSITLLNDGDCSGSADNTTAFATGGIHLRFSEADAAHNPDYFSVLMVDSNNIVLWAAPGTLFDSDGIRELNYFLYVRFETESAPFRFILVEETEHFAMFASLGEKIVDDPSFIDDFEFDPGSLDPDCPSQFDVTAPTVTSIARQTPAEQTTDADSLTWRVRFSETVKNVDPADFSLSGSTASLSVSANRGDTIDVTASGGDLENLNAEVTLSFASSPSISDPSGNSLDASLVPLETYLVSNDRIAPTVTLIARQTPTDEVTNADSVVFRVSFSEDVANISSDGSDFVASGTTGSPTSVSQVGGDAAVYDVTVSGGDLASVNGAVSLGFAPGQDVEDLAGNALTNTASGSSQSYTLDNLVPTVSSIALVGTPAATAASVDFLVTFSEPIGTAQTGDFSLSTFSSSGGTVSAVSGSGDTRTVTVSDLSGEGSIRLDVPSGSGIADLAGNTVSAAFSGGALHGVDRAAPVVTGIALSGSPASDAASIAFTVSFNEDAVGVTADDFSLTLGSSAQGTIGDPVATTPRTWTVPVTGLAGEGSLRLDLNAGTDIADGFGNDQPCAFTAGASHIIDRSVPVITGITLNGSPDARADSVTFTVSFNEDVFGASAQAFTLDTTGTASGTISEPQGSGRERTVTVSEISGTGSIRLDASESNAIADGTGNEGVAAFPTGATHNVDRDAPAVTSIAIVDSPAATAVGFDFLVTFSEAVDRVDTADFVLTTFSSSQGSVSAVSGSGNTRTVSVSGLGGEGSIRLDVRADNDIEDLVGNTVAGGYTDGALHVVDRSGAQIQSIAVVGSPAASDPSIQFLVSFSEGVANVDVNDFVLTTFSSAQGSVTAVNGSGNTRTVTAANLDGEGDIRLDVRADNDIEDLAGNGNLGAYTDGALHTVDRIGPTVQSITVIGTPQANDSSIEFLVTFSEAVTNVGAESFVLTTFSSSQGSVSAISGTGNTRTVTVSGLGGEGSIRLDVRADNGVTDIAGNGGLSGFTGGALHVVDRTGAQVQTITVVGTPDATAATIDFLVTFNENVTSVDVADFALTAFSTSQGSINAVNGSGNTRTVTVSGLDGEGSIRLDVRADNDIQDTSGNSDLGGYTDGALHVVDRVSPVVTGIAIAGSPAANATSVNFTITFNEDIAALDAADLALTSTGTAGGAIGTPSANTPRDWSVPVTTITGEGTLRLDLIENSGVADSFGNASPAAFASGSVHTVDRVGPRLISVTRSDPTEQTTTADELTFRIVFDDIIDAQTTDFAATGTTANVSAIQRRPGGPTTPSVYEVTLSGGDLANFNGTVGLVLSPSHALQDSLGNALTDTAATGVVETYTLTNVVVGPVLSIVTAVATPTSDATPDFEFSTTEAGTLAVGGSCGTSSSTTINAAGDQTITLTQTDNTSPLLAGTYSDCTVTVTDTGGNPSSPLSIGSFEVETTARNISIAGATGDENAGVLTFTITSSAAANGAITVNYATTDGTASAGEDYTAAGGTATILDGTTSTTFDVPLSDDAIVEADETFTVTLSNLSGLGASLTGATATGTITDDDRAEVTIADIAVNEDAGTATVTLTLSDAVVGGFSVDVSTVDNTATVADGDYVALASGTEIFAGTAGETQTLEITVGVDSKVEADEIIDVAMSNLVPVVSKADAISITDTASVTISNDDAASLSIADVSGNEDDGAITVAVTLDAAVDGGLSVNVGTADGTATVADGDYTAVLAETLSFNGTSSEIQTFKVLPTKDSSLEEDETLTVSMSNVSTTIVNAADVTATDTATVTIANDDTDARPPDVNITTASTAPVRGIFTVTFSFTQDVTGFGVEDITVGNGVVSNFSATSASVFTADITPTSDGPVTIDVAAGVANNSAGDANTAANQLSIEADVTAPGLTIAASNDVLTGPFTATFSFSEDVIGFDLTDIVIDNGSASGFSGTGAVYTASITPETLGLVTITVPANAAQDAAGNGNIAADFVDEVEAETATVDLVIDSTVVDPGGVAASAMVTNPGTDPLPFTATPDVSWLDVDPISGTIPSLEELELTVTLNDNVDALEPGDYRGTVTVVVGGGAAPASVVASAQNRPRSITRQILAEIPISLEVKERFGSLQLIARTPAGVSGDASFSYVSDLEVLNDLTLTTRGGQARSSAIQGILFGSYTVTQSSPAGWRVESISCTGDTDGGSTFDVTTGQAVIDLDPGEDLVCTYENVRDEDAVRIATQKAIYNFMSRRADRLVSAAPDFSKRFSERESQQRGGFSADIDGSGRSRLAFSTSLSGLRNAAAADTPDIAGVTNYERPFAEHLDVWVSAEAAFVEDNRAGEDASSNFTVAQLGVDYQLSDTLILGLMAQYDWMEESSSDINTLAGAVAGAEIEGEGWMAGPYAALKLSDTLIFDALALYGASENTVNPLGLYEDDFETERFMVQAKLTGEWSQGPWRVRPQASLTHFEETQSAYTDSLSFVIPEQTLSLGRLTAGPEVAWRNDTPRGQFLELTTSLRAVWDYEAADLRNDSGGFIGADNDLRADARLGLNAGFTSGMSLRIEAAFAGLGVGQFEATSLRIELRYPFGVRGRGGASFSGDGRLTNTFQADCDSLVGNGFDYAAGRMTSCDRAPNAGYWQ